MKKIFTLLITFCLVLVLLSLSVNAKTVDNGTCGDNVNWVLDDTGTLTISGNGAMKNYIYTVSVPWASHRKSITAVTITEGVSHIGNYAFSSCSNLTSVSIPKGVTSIGASAFLDCRSLTSISLPDGVTSIGDGAFSFCQKLTSITFPKSVTTIRPGVFTSCTALEKLIFQGNAPTFGLAAFLETNTTVYYPAGDSSWTEDIRKDYGGTLTWVAYSKAKAPKNVTASNDPVTGKPQISWNEGTYAVKYQVYRATTKNGTYKKIATTTKTSYTDQKTTAGTRYYYKIKSVNVMGQTSALSDYISRVCDLLRPEISSITMIASSGNPKISWKAVEGAKEYAIYRKVSGGEYKKIATTASKSYTDTSTKVGTKYYYKVVAVHKSVTVANSAKSASKSCTADLAQPKLKASNDTSSGQVKLVWGKINDASMYYIYRATAKDGDYKKLSSTTATSFTDSDASVGKTYYYKVKAIYSSNTSANSAYSSVVSGMRDLARPNVTVKLSSGKPKLSWDKVSKTSTYYIYCATSENGEYKKIASTSSTSYTDKSAKVDKTYYYKVKAIYSRNTSANSVYSAVDTIKVK